ncbi:MAG: hypothetical protein WCC84_03145, partial [Candidatus Cybelea sp.]
ITHCGLDPGSGVKVIAYVDEPTDSLVRRFKKAVEKNSISRRPSPPRVVCLEVQTSAQQERYGSKAAGLTSTVGYRGAFVNGCA